MNPKARTSREIPFFRYKEAQDPKKPRNGYDSAGNLLDPWGKPYVILIDTNQDGRVTLHGEVIKASIAVWSYGRNGKPDLPDKGDDVMSWK